jgi:hypothetical protein
VIEKTRFISGLLTQSVCVIPLGNSL